MTGYTHTSSSETRLYRVNYLLGFPLQYYKLARAVKIANRTSSDGTKYYVRLWADCHTFFNILCIKGGLRCRSVAF
jgi:hypothetical protein